MTGEYNIQLSAHGGRKSLLDFKNYFDTLTDPREQYIAETAFFFGRHVANEPEHVIALIHGINTDGEWQEALADQIREECGLETYTVGYGNFNPVHFLWPYWSMRKEPLNRVIQQLRAIRAERPNARISIVAHSFGTHIISRILIECHDLNFHRILLCGSIVDSQFPWESMRSKFSQVVNDVGTRDLWPILAKQSTWGYGDSGSFGFKNILCRDRHFNFAHSDFMTSEHFSVFWKTFLTDGEIVPSPWTKVRKAGGWQVKVARYSPIKYLLWWGVVPLIFFASLYSVWSMGFYLYEAKFK